MLKTQFVLIFLIITSLCANAQQGRVSIDRDPDLDRLLAIYEEVKANADYFTIQIGFGTYDDAEQLAKEASFEFPEYKPNIVFDSPTYRVQVGKFNSRLEAEKKYLEVRQKFPAALLLRPGNGDRIPR